ncbi:hypothetical protein KCU65_g4832, partial [Aureobasidium melanogenum]
MHHPTPRDKEAAKPEAQTDIVRPKSRSVWKKAVLCLAAGVSFFTFLHGWDIVPSYHQFAAPITESSTTGQLEFSWYNIEASPDLTYHQCYDDYYCAKLQVPMDWWRNSTHPGNNISIAVIRLPAKVPVTDPRYGGAVLTNPGGPGGSGIAQMLRSGRATQTIVDAENRPNNTLNSSIVKYHDIISFDPRGVGYTTPAIHCEHVNTSPVARDMLEIIERHAEWLAKQAALARESDDFRGQDKHVERRYTRGEPKLKYWGNSYGTILGQTFASMFATRIDRIVLDGVCNAHDYFFGSWFSNLSDADAILDRFFAYCHAAGPSACSFYSATPESIKQNYENLLTEIFEKPIVVPSSKTRGPDVITWSDVKSMVRLGMYQPLIYSPMVSDLLTSLSTNNGTIFADFKAMSNTFSCPSSDCISAGPFSDECNTDSNMPDATLAILCTDGPGLGNIDETSFQEYWHALQHQSECKGNGKELSWFSGFGTRFRRSHILVITLPLHSKSRPKILPNRSFTTSKHDLFIGSNTIFDI